MELLIVEDDQSLGQSLRKGLMEEGFHVTVSKEGFQARDLILSRDWDLLIFDMMLPGLSGIQLCELTRFKKIKTPVLMLSALSEPEDKIKALDIGADDYLTKPFNFQELVSRINALIRRNSDYSQKESTHLFCADLTLDYAKNRVERSGEVIDLSSKEFHLLKLLLERKGSVVNRSTILQRVWNTEHPTFTNVIDVYISYLRSKIDNDFPQKLIQTVKGRGYMLSDQNEN